MRKRRSATLTAEPGQRVSKYSFDLFDKGNRGLLLDVVVFVANIFLLRLLSIYVLGLFNEASADDHGAKSLLTLAAIGMWVLPAAGAVRTNS